MFLAIELLDELAFGVHEAAWPAIRADLSLSYLQIGLVLSSPRVVSVLVEPAIGIAGDTRRRRLAVILGGVGVAVALALTAAAGGFAALLFASVLFASASGAFVSLSQATLMDRAPDDRESNMVRWTIAGSVGNVLGPLLLAGALLIGFGWRAVFAALAVMTVPLVFGAGRVHAATTPEESPPGWPELVRAALAALRDRAVLRWLVVLEVQDLLGDLLLGFLALYLVDVVRTTSAIGGLAVGVWTAAGLIGGIVVLRVLRRIDGFRYLRASAVVSLVLFPTFLMTPNVGLKLTLLAALGAVTAGWYPVSKAQLFRSMHGASGIAVALSSVSSFLGAALPLAIAAVASRAGLGVAMWLLILGPVGVLALVPRRSAAVADR